MKKRITIKQVEKECAGSCLSFIKLSPKQAFYLVRGAASTMSDTALRAPRVTEVESPSMKELRDLAVKLYARG